MSFKNKLIHELKEIFWTTLYFSVWIGLFLTLKILLLEEYHIGFYQYSVILIGALIAAKVVLILNNVPFSSWTKRQPAIIGILLRTLLYLAGIFIVMILEKSFEGRHEYGGFFNALKGISDQTEFYHVLVNTICIFGALLGFNIWSVVTKQLGEGWLWKILSLPVSFNNK